MINEIAPVIDRRLCTSRWCHSEYQPSLKHPDLRSPRSTANVVLSPNSVTPVAAHRNRPPTATEVPVPVGL